MCLPCISCCFVVVPDRVSASLQVALFEALAEDASLPLPERSYSRIVWTYRALKDRRINLLQRCRLELEPLIDRLEQDPGTLICQRPNRRNRAKLLISASTALMLVLATQADRRALLQCSQRIGVWFDRLDILAIEADAAFRMTGISAAACWWRRWRSQRTDEGCA